MVNHSEPMPANWANLLIGASIAMLSAQVMTHHAGIESVNGVLTLGAGFVLWAYGMALALDVAAEEFGKLRELIAS